MSALKKNMWPRQSQRFLLEASRSRAVYLALQNVRSKVHPERVWNVLQKKPRKNMRFWARVTRIKTLVSSWRSYLVQKCIFLCGFFCKTFHILSGVLCYSSGPLGLAGTSVLPGGSILLNIEFFTKYVCRTTRKYRQIQWYTSCTVPLIPRKLVLQLGLEGEASVVCLPGLTDALYWISDCDIHTSIYLRLFVRI